MAYIKGNYKRSLFQSDSGYVVGLFKVKENDIDDFHNNTVVVFTGYFLELNENDTYIFNGDFVIHQRYGKQFQVKSYERCKMEDKDSIVSFLSSGLFKGIGLSKAKKIVAAFGKDTLDVIMNNPSNLILIPTVSQKNINNLHDTLLEYENSYQIIIDLSELGFNTKDSMIIYNKYKKSTLDVMNDNIYQIANDIKEISFNKVDVVALKSNYSLDDLRRCEAAIIYALNEVCNLFGHTYLEYDEVFHYTNRVLGINLSDEAFLIALKNLQLSGKIVYQNNFYYLKALYDAEDNIVKRLGYLVRKDKVCYKNIDDVLSLVEEENTISYNDVQKEAIKGALSENVLIITGGPGTGKTTIIKAIVNLYQKLNKLSWDEINKRVSLLAPTGRASKRVAVSTFLSASTIHRFLKWNKDTNTFAVNEYNKSDTKMVIIDEASMVDTYLWDSLLKGLKVDTKIIIVGDYNQLPSVGPGQVLKDLIECDKIPCIKLNYLYRQAKDSNIIRLAYDINNGDIDDSILLDKSDLSFVSANRDIAFFVKEICDGYKDASFMDFQVLSPMYKTLNGIDNLNKMLQDIFNPPSYKKKEIKVGDVIYREGDKILQLVNVVEENIFNGDIGKIEKIDKKDIYVNFDSHLVKVSPSNYSSIQHGYVISVHKAQGSEFKTVVLLVLSEYNRMLYRKLYYTAVTRCREKLYIIGDINALRRASCNDLSDIRKTTLKDRLCEHI